jgi:hypothetical protein
VTKQDFRREGAGCGPAGNGSDSQAIEPEVLPPEAPPQARQSYALALGQNGTVDCRLFYFVLGIALVEGAIIYCNSRHNK